MAALGRTALHLNVKRVWDHLGSSTSSNIVTSRHSPAAAASWHHEVSDFQARAYSTKPRGILGFLGKDAMFPSRERTRPSAGNDYAVDTLDLSDDDDEADRRKPSHLVAKPDEKVTEAALDKGANVATSALDNVGSVLTKTGLEVQLDVSLQELTIDKLVLKDLGLVLVVKTKPPGSEPEQPDTKERKVRSGSQPTPAPEESDGIMY